MDDADLFADADICFWGGPEDGLVYVTEGNEIWNASDAERVVNAFYSDTEWRAIETSWLVRCEDDRDDVEVGGPQDESAQPAWLLVHIGAETIRDPAWANYFRNPFFGAERIDRAAYGRWLRESVRR